jgi:hypothetical protein
MAIEESVSLQVGPGFKNKLLAMQPLGMSNRDMYEWAVDNALEMAKDDADKSLRKFLMKKNSLRREEGEAAIDARANAEKAALRDKYPLEVIVA